MTRPRRHEPDPNPPRPTPNTAHAEPEPTPEGASSPLRAGHRGNADRVRASIRGRTAHARTDED